MTDDAGGTGFATGGLVAGSVRPIGADIGRTLTAPTVACACGREIHVTVTLDRREIENAVRRVLIEGRRQAMSRGSGAAREP